MDINIHHKNINKIYNKIFKENGLILSFKLLNNTNYEWIK